MKDRLLPVCDLNVDTRGVDDGKGRDEFDVRVIVDGVRSVVAFVGEGGNTNKV